VTPQLVLTVAFGATAAVFLLLAMLYRANRVILIGATVFMGGAAVAAYVDAFWPMALLALLGVVTALAATEFMDLSWRLRAGFTGMLVVLGFLVMWPTLSHGTGGKLPMPAYVRDRVNFRLLAGLDLRGGLRLVYTVDVDEAIKDKRDSYYEDMRRELAKLLGLHQGDEAPPEEVYQKLREKIALEAPRRPANVIRLVVQPGTDPGKIDQRFMERFGAELGFTRSEDRRNYEFQIRSGVETQIRERAVGQAREIILRRVDELGLREAAISTRDEDIIIEVPGEDEKSFATIREIISQTARLEFKLLDDDTDFFGQIRASLKEETLPEGLEFAGENVSVGLDENGEAETRQNTFALMKRLPKETMQQTLQRFKEWVATLPVPPDREIGYEIDYRMVDELSLKQEEAGYRTYFLKSRAEITGDLIREAAAVPDQSQGSMGGWYVSITFTDQGGRAFERITGANIKRRFAIILDGRVESAPVIQSRIPGGQAQITLGSSDPEAQLRDARKLELVLRSGALPAPISPSNEQRIGPTLGRDAIDLAVQGALGGSLLVLLFMIIYYQRAGFIADIAVVLNLFLQLSILAMFGAAMTLPGIAGLALTIGMSVDSNVLINERIREELAAGKSPRAAVEIGYRRAFSAIIDGHFTTVIAGVVLAQYGTGPLKGFAVTLIVGVVCSVFTGVTVSRIMFDLWVRYLGRQGRLDMG
jgi:preprotein translocase subunit SecD